MYAALEENIQLACRKEEVAADDIFYPYLPPWNSSDLFSWKSEKDNVEQTVPSSI